MKFSKINFFNFEQPKKILKRPKNLKTSFFEESTKVNSVLDEKDLLNKKEKKFSDEILKESIFVKNIINFEKKEKTNFRFWENNSTNFKGNLIKLDHRKNILLSQENNYEIIKNLDKPYLITKNQFFIKEIDLIRELCQPFLNNSSNIVRKKGKKFEIISEFFSCENYSFSFLTIFFNNYIKKLNNIAFFYELSKKYILKTDQKNYFVNNLLLNLFQLLESYINFKTIKLSKTRSLLLFIKSLNIFHKEINFFIKLIKKFENLKEINLLDYFLIFKKNLVNCDFGKILIEKGFKLATLGTMRMIENIAFKNTSLEILNKNLNIYYNKDNNFNYKTYNVPIVYKNLIKFVLSLKQNYHFLYGVDEELYQISLNFNLRLFENFDFLHLKKRFLEAKKILLEKKNNVNNIIIKRLIFRKKKKLRKKIDRYKKNLVFYKKYYKNQKLILLNKQYEKYFQSKNKNFIKMQIKHNKIKKKYMTKFEKIIDKNLLIDRKLKNIETFYNKKFNINFENLEKTTKKFISQNRIYNNQNISKETLELFQKEYLKIEYDFDKMKENIENIENDLEKDLLKIEKIDFNDIIKSNEELLDIDFSYFNNMNNIDVFNNLCLNILKYNSILLNNIVCYYFFEEKKLKKYYKIFKSIFLGEYGDYTNIIANTIFNSKGKIKIFKIYKLDKIFSEIIPFKITKKLKFNFLIKEFDENSDLNFIKTDLSQNIEIITKFKNPLRILFNNKVLNILLKIYLQILKISKVSTILNKIWKKLKHLDKYITDPDTMNLYFLNIKYLTVFLNQYKQYIFHFLIEGSFQKLFKNSKKNNSFNEIFMSFTNFLGIIFEEMFLTKKYSKLYESLNFIFLTIVNFYKYLKVIEVNSLKQNNNMKKNLFKIKNTLRNKIDILKRVIEKTRITHKNRLWNFN